MPRKHQSRIINANIPSSKLTYTCGNATHDMPWLASTATDQQVSGVGKCQEAGVRKLCLGADNVEAATTVTSYH